MTPFDVLEFRIKKILERNKSKLSEVVLREERGKVEVYKNDILIGVANGK